MSMFTPEHMNPGIKHFISFCTFEIPKLAKQDPQPRMMHTNHIYKSNDYIEFNRFEQQAQGKENLNET